MCREHWDIFFSVMVFSGSLSFLAFVYLGSLFSWQAWLEVCHLVYPFEEPALDFIDIFPLKKISFVFHLWFLLFLSSPDFRFYLFFFLILLSGRLGCVFEFFVCFWGKPILHKLPFRKCFYYIHRYCLVVFLLSFASRYF